MVVHGIERKEAGPTSAPEKGEEDDRALSAESRGRVAGWSGRSRRSARRCLRDEHGPSAVLMRSRARCRLKPDAACPRAARPRCSRSTAAVYPARAGVGSSLFCAKPAPSSGEGEGGRKYGSIVASGEREVRERGEGEERGRGREGGRGRVRASAWSERGERLHVVQPFRGGGADSCPAEGGHARARARTGGGRMLAGRLNCASTGVGDE